MNAPRKNKMQHTMGHRVRRMRSQRQERSRSRAARLLSRTRRQQRALAVMV